MALARLALKNIGKRVVSPCCYSLVSQSFAERSLGSAQNQRWSSEILKGFAAKSCGGDEKTKGQEVAVAEADKKSKLSPRRKHRRGLWRKDNNDLVPALHGLGSALVQAAGNINKLLENLSPSRLLGRVKEQDNCYKLKYYMPGLSKEDLKITVEDGVLRIKGEHKEEEEEQDSDDEQWVAMSYGYYNTTILLPEDAKVDEIKGEMKDGVLEIVIPKSETPKKDVKEIEIK